MRVLRLAREREVHLMLGSVCMTPGIPGQHGVGRKIWPGLYME